MQHSDNTWSHKPGMAEPLTTCFDCDLALTNDNIMSHAYESHYASGVLKFFYITKNAVIDYGHLRGTEINTSNTVITIADYAGNYFSSSKDITIPVVNIDCKIDYVGDVDYYCFTSDSQRSYEFNIISDFVDLTVVLYNSEYEPINTVTSASGSISFTCDLDADSTVFIRISSNGQEVYEFDREYTISIE